jgi:hypothetical protein
MNADGEAYASAGEPPAETNTTSTVVQEGYAPVVHCAAETNTTARLGRIERGILAHLATGPAGFDGCIVWSPGDKELLEHGEPYGVTIREITDAVYQLSEPPSQAQTRAVQRAIARLDVLGLIDRWYSVRRFRDKPRTTTLGFEAPMPETALFVAYANWRCKHIERRDRENEEHRALTEALTAAAAKLDPVAALRFSLGRPAAATAAELCTRCGGTGKEPEEPATGTPDPTNGATGRDNKNVT